MEKMTMQKSNLHYSKIFFFSIPLSTKQKITLPAWFVLFSV